MRGEIYENKSYFKRNNKRCRNKAIPATPENINKLNSKNEKIKKNHDNDVKKANELKEQLNSKEIVLKVKAGNNWKVFGSVGGKEIAEAIK